LLVRDSLKLPGRARSRPGGCSGAVGFLQPLSATNYEIRASLDAVGRVMTAQAKVDFAGGDSRIVDVELSQTLRVNGVLTRRETVGLRQG